MKIIRTARYDENWIQMSKMELANGLLDWHGGMSSGLYSVGSSWLAGDFDVPEENIQLAISELDDNINKKVNFPETMTDENIIELKKLKQRLQQLTAVISANEAARSRDQMKYDEDTYRADYDL